MISIAAYKKLQGANGHSHIANLRRNIYKESSDRKSVLEALNQFNMLIGAYLDQKKEIPKEICENAGQYYKVSSDHFSHYGKSLIQELNRVTQRNPQYAKLLEEEMNMLVPRGYREHTETQPSIASMREYLSNIDAMFSVRSVFAA